eukprot:2009222-Amphidinium_carterae.1
MRLPLAHMPREQIVAIGFIGSALSEGYGTMRPVEVSQPFLYSRSQPCLKGAIDMQGVAPPSGAHAEGRPAVMCPLLLAHMLWSGTQHVAQSIACVYLDRRLWP